MLESLSVNLASMTRANIALDDSILICDVKSIELMTLLCCVAAETKPIIITNIDQTRLNVAKKICSRVKTYKIQPDVSMEQAGKEMSDLAGGHLATALECSGQESSINAAVSRIHVTDCIFFFLVPRPGVHGHRYQWFHFALWS